MKNGRYYFVKGISMFLVIFLVKVADHAAGFDLFYGDVTWQMLLGILIVCTMGSIIGELASGLRAEKE